MTDDKPVLEKPGAGLPFFQSLYVRFWVGPVVSRRLDKAGNLRLFKAVGARIVKETGLVPEGLRDERFLVPKMRGIEDSSRFWSANEVLEHLVITGTAMRGLIVDLAEGRRSNVVVRIEDFKPKGSFTGKDGRAGFSSFMDETLAMLEPLKIERGGPTHRHPWLGPLDALQWTWLLAGHSGIHLAQLSAVRLGVANT